VRRYDMTGVRLIIFLLVVACLIGVVVLLGSAQCGIEEESNDTASAADGLGELPGSWCRSGTVLPAGDVDVYWFEALEPLTVVMETLTDGDTLLALYRENGEFLAGDDDGGGGGASRLERSIEAGTYFLVVSAYGSNVVASYEIWIEGSASTPAPTPAATCPLEVEDNDTGQNANALSTSGGSMCRTGAVLPAGDVDLYSFSVPTTTSVVIETKSQGDTVLRLFDADGQYLTENDDGGEGTASRIAGPLDAGRYYVMVYENGNDESISSYMIEVRVGSSSTGSSGTQGTVSPPVGGAVAGVAPAWGWWISGSGIVLSAWGAIDRDCPSDYDFNMKLCDKETYTFTLGSDGFIAVGLIDQAGEWITAYVYDASNQRVASKLGVAGPIYSDWVEVPAGTYTVDVVPGKRLDNSPYELHVFFSTTLPDPGYLVETYGPADIELPG
jgi:hypothetical protein